MSSQVQGETFPFSGCRITNSANQSISHATLTAITFDTESYDTDSYHSTSSQTSRMVVPATGYYLIAACVEYATNTTGNRLIGIARNGTQIAWLRIAATVSDVYDLSIAQVIDASAGDYFEIYAYQTSGSSLDIQVSNIPISASCTRLG